MDRRDKLRRTGILCIHALRHFAYLDALAECQADWDKTEFWIAAHNNFLDVGILEWCKLFTETDGKHHWLRSISEPSAFESSLLRAIALTDGEFSEYRDKLRWYRNRFLAHLDNDNVYRLPKITTARHSASFLLQWLLDIENDCDAFPDAPASADGFYVRCLEHARSITRSKS